jgi:hypothetical protein
MAWLRQMSFEKGWSMTRIGRLVACLSLCVGLLVCGCASPTTLGRWEGPAAPAPTTSLPWSYGDEKGQIIQTSHYRIHTTIKDEEVLLLLPQIMEGAVPMYQQVVPNLTMSESGMDCYVFHWRSEWDAYTQRNAGKDASIYLQIRNGGYTMRDRYVAYYIGRSGTFSVTAHEGWHQFLGRHFIGRVPPFLEEGLACMFETISWKDRLPRWNLMLNPPRAQTLRRAMDSKTIWPLEKLCAMHAGDIVGDASGRIDAFYAQSWAFARFLWEGENGKYRPALQKWLAETAAGTVYDPAQSYNLSTAPWNRHAAVPMMEHYLGMDINSIDKEYQLFMKKIAYEELSAQWRS